MSRYALPAAFSPELVDVAIYVFDVSGGDKIPRKGGPGIMRSDLLIINKIDLAPYVGASSKVMDRDARIKRGERPFIFTNLKEDIGLDTIIVWLEQHLNAPSQQRRSIIDAHAPYVGQLHIHSHDDEAGHMANKKGFATRQILPLFSDQLEMVFPQFCRARCHPDGEAEGTHAFMLPR